MESNTRNKIEITNNGMITDINDNLVNENSYTYMLNGNYQNFDGNGFLLLQNEQSNFLLCKYLGCIIGFVNVIQKDKTFFWIINNNKLEIHYLNNNDIYCDESGNETLNYKNNCLDCKTNKESSDIKENITNLIKIVEINCFNYNCDTRLDIEYRITDCELEFYWVDKLSEPKKITLDLNNNFSLLKLYYIITGYEDNECKLLIYSNLIDCNKLSVNLCYTKLKIKLEEVLSDNGQLKEGVYQFMIAYSDSFGNLLSNYLSVTNIIPIFQYNTKNEYGLETNKSIKLKIENIDYSSLFKYYNLVVSETIDNFTSFYLVGTFDVSKNTYIYTGANKSSYTNVLIDELIGKRLLYTKANGITQSNGILFYYNLEEGLNLNLQQAANFVKLNWFTTQVLENIYSNLNDTFYKRTFQRDETYSFGIIYEDCNGNETCAFPLIGREKNSCDTEIINNCDILLDNNNCSLSNNLEAWRVYNTASITSALHEAYDKCNDTVWELGDFSYWESSETYLNELSVWGDLCGKLIRHFKFLDSFISHIHDRKDELSSTSFNEKNNIYLIGIKVDISSVKLGLDNAVTLGLITIEQRNKIKSFRIVRSNRSNNKSVIAKGLLYDMWSYDNKKSDCLALEKIYYLNYLFNDLHDDEFLYSSEDIYNCEKLSLNKQKFLNTGKYTFHSLDTHFNNLNIGNILKIETNEYGEADINFNKSENHSKYKILNKNGVRAITRATLAYLACVRCGEGEGFFSDVLKDLFTLKVCKDLFTGLNILNYSSSDTSVNVLFSNIDFYTVFKQFEDILIGFEKYKDLFWQYQAVGNYNNYKKINNDGNKVRQIENFSYLNLTFQSVETQDGNITINNYNRESSLFLSVKDDCLIPDLIIKDNSRTLISKDVTSNCYEWNIEVNLRFIDKFFTISFTDCDGKQKETRIDNLYHYTYLATITLSINIGIGASILFLGLGQLLLFSGALSGLIIGFSRRKYNTKICSQIQLSVSSLHQLIYSKTGNYCNLDCSCNYNLKKTVSSYYASIKNNILNQYGNIFDIDWIETTGYSNLLDSNNLYLFGGDTFISKFALKRKLQSFYNLLHNLLNGSDIVQSELMNVAYLKYYLDYLFNIFKNGFSDLIDSSALNTFSNVNDNCNSNLTLSLIASLSEKISDDVYEKIKCNYKLDCYSNNNSYIDNGIIYSYFYGILSFWVESDINLNYRNAENNLEKNFYLNTTDLNNWLQEDNTLIKFDNFYNYDRSYSKQIKESFICNNQLGEDFKKCKNKFLNRVIYSDTSYEDFKLNNYYDFLYKDGNLISLDGIENNKVLVRFEDKLKVFNSYITILTNSESIQVGNGSLFQSKLQEYADTDLGYAGSQHLAILHTEYGHIFVDSKRGDIFILENNNNGLTEISQLGMNQWFKENLLFKISKYFDIDIDSNKIGIKLSYDKRYSRFFITKTDFKPLNNELLYNNNKFYKNGLEVSLYDKNNFCNCSWTIGFDLKKKQWISFYSFILNDYIDFQSYFLSLKDNGFWVHNLRKQSFQKFYGKLYLFIIDYKSQQQFSNNNINSIEFNTELLRYHNDNDFYYEKNKVLFNKAYVYNKNQNSGLLEFEKNNLNNLSLNRLYLKDKVNKWIILITNAEYNWRFNLFFDLVKDRNYNNLIWNKDCNGHEIKLNNKNINYNLILTKTLRLRKDSHNIRLINDINEYNKIIFKWNNLKQVKSYR